MIFLLIIFSCQSSTLYTNRTWTRYRISSLRRAQTNLFYFAVEIAVSEIQERANMDVSLRPMVEICHKRSVSDEPIVKFFAISPKEKRMLQHLHRVQSSVIFRDLWHKCGSRAAELYNEDKGNGRLSVQQVQEMIWTHSFNRWREFWERVISGDIYLKDVDVHLIKFQGDPQSLEEEFKPVSHFFGEEENLDDVLRQRKIQIEQCQNLREGVEAAECIWKFKEAMDMNGDFKILNDLRNQVKFLFRILIFVTLIATNFINFCI